MLAPRLGLALELDHGLIGQAAFDATGKMLPPDTLKLCKDSRIVLLGPVGGHQWEHPSHGHHPKQALYALRGWLGTYATFRPFRLDAPLATRSPLDDGHRTLDLLLVHDH